MSPPKCYYSHQDVTEMVTLFYRAEKDKVKDIKRKKMAKKQQRVKVQGGVLETNAPFIQNMPIPMFVCLLPFAS